MTQFEEMAGPIEVDGVQIADPKVSDFFKSGLRFVRTEGQPDGSVKYFSEKTPDPLTAFSGATHMISKEEAVDQLGLTKESDETTERIADLKEWWVEMASMDVGMVAEKAVTYGSNSLEQLGRKMAQLGGRKVVSSEEAQELGCWVYLTGKVERWTDAVMRGERPKDDTLTDIIAYATMATRIRQAGGWPDSRG
jgi:hypothetical protein